MTAPAVHVEGEPGGLAQMIARLVEANVAADPGKARLLETTRGLVGLQVSDTGESIACKFVPGTLTVAHGGAAIRTGADLVVTGTEDALLGLSTVPLRAGLPDPLTAAGRAVARQVLDGRLKLKMGPGGPRMLTVLTRLLTVT